MRWGKLDNFPSPLSMHCTVRTVRTSSLRVNMRMCVRAVQFQNARMSIFRSTKLVYEMSNTEQDTLNMEYLRMKLALDARQAFV